MKTIAAAVLAVFFFASTIEAFSSMTPELSAFLKFKHDFEIKYSNVDEESKRFEIFKMNLKEIARLNAESSGTIYGITQFSDMTKDEFSEKIMMPESPSRKTGKVFQVNDDTIPTPVSLDWRQKSVVSHVKNQGQCGSCWAFSVTAAIESHYAIRRGIRILNSEQQLLDCVTNNYGCTGGYLDTAYQYVGYVGQVTENSYEYIGYQENCSLPSTAEVKYETIDGYFDITGPEDNIAKFIAQHGPVSFSIACPEEMMHYKGGVFDLADCSKNFVGYHAMAIVGYTPEYWIIKNSWGTKWGDSGYVFFKRGKNLCGLANGAGGPILA